MTITLEKYEDLGMVFWLSPSMFSIGFLWWTLTIEWGYNL